MSAEKKAGKVVEKLVKEYKAIIAGNESAIRAFIKSAHKTPSRDLEATLKEASKSGAISAIRPAYANYFDLANTCLSIDGADSVAVSDFMKIVALAQRTLKKEGALELVARVSTWSDFESKTRTAEKVKKSKNPPKNRKPKASADSADSVPAEVRATINGVIEFALGALADLEGDALIIAPTHFEMASKLLGGLKASLASSKAIAGKHPVKA
jgi:hypothetical protein